MTEAAPLPLRLAQIGLVLLAAALGLLAGVSPMFGIGAAFGVVYAIVVATDLALGLGLFVAATFVESIAAFNGLSIAKAMGGLLFLSWLALVTTTDRAKGRKLVADHPVLVAALMTLAGWTVLSALWAEDSHVALSAALRWTLNISLFPVVFAAVRERKHVRWVFALFVAGALVSAAFGIVTGTTATTEAQDFSRLGGSGVNANELGQLLIVAVVMAGALAASRELAPPARATAGGAAGLALIALLLTFSRGALVGLVGAMLVAPLLVGKGRRVPALLLVTTVAAAGSLYIFALAPAADRAHITDSQDAGSGREDIWKVGVRMVKAHPVLGVGADNYPISAVHYLLEPGTIVRSDYIVDEPKPAHNIYLQAIAELGIVGLVLMLFIFGFCLRSLLVAARAFAARRDRTMEMLSRSLLIALVGYMASEFFSTAIYSKQLWTLLALTVAIRALAVKPPAPA